MNALNPLSDIRAAARLQTAQTVRAPLNFILPQEGKPYFLSAALTGTAPVQYFDTEDRPVTIQDMRPFAAGLSLDREGFELHREATAVTDFADDKAAAQIYDSEVEALLMAKTGADRVVIFDRTRRSDAPGGAANKDGLRGPAGRVHVDYTATSGPARARDILGGAEVERVLAAGGRLQQVNVWRPTQGPVRRSPLALADAESIKAADLIATDQVFADRVGEIYNLAYAADQRWFWAPEMTRDEVLLIKGWDSLEDGRARFTPHSSFQIPDQDPAAPPRESIEVRTYLVFEG